MNKPKLSFLILTHNRPLLFKRGINSILQFEFPFEIEILVNNDSNDIQEIKSDTVPIIYSYIQSDNLSDIYKYLFIQARGEYIYYLEDDDYLLNGFLKVFMLIDTYDLIYCKYRPEKIDDYLKIKFQKEPEVKNDLFQLSQIIFKKELLDLNIFPKTNDINNDWKLYQSLKNNSLSFYFLNKEIFRQTCDGNDNISFKELCNDTRFN
jgi:glycosyltransferase involved in cell wall biosynthesis